MTRVNTSMRPVELFGFALPRMPGGQREPFLQRDEVRPLGLEHDAVLAEVELVDDVVLDPPLDGLAVGQEAAPDPVRDLAEPEVEARGLHVLGRDREAIGVDDPGRDRLFEVLARQHARLARREVERSGGIGSEHASMLGAGVHARGVHLPLFVRSVRLWRN